ncbi:MAG: hypothetical protein WCC64_15060, partial [Aliidongia sp.]
MRIRTLFLIGLAALAVPAICIAGWMAWSATTEWSQARTVTRQARAMSDLMRVLTSIAVESGQLQEASLAETPNLDALARFKAATDDSLDRAASTAAGTGTGAIVEDARRTITDLRRRTEETMRQPLSARDGGFLKELLAIRVALGDRIRAQLGAFETAIVQSDPAVGMLVQLGSQMMAMRDNAGARSVLITPWLNGKPFTPDNIATAYIMSGRLAGAWDRALSTIGQIRPSAKLAAARDQAQSAFFDAAEPRYLGFLAAALGHGDWGMPYADFRKFTVAALAEIVPVREAAMAEAVDRADAQSAGAAMRLILAALAGLGEAAVASVSLTV